MPDSDIDEAGDGSGKPSSDPARAKPVSSLKLNVLGVDLAEQGRCVFAKFGISFEPNFF